MKTVAVFDCHSYSLGLVNDVLRFAVNAQADLTVLAVQGAGGCCGPDAEITAFKQSVKNCFDGVLGESVVGAWKDIDEEFSSWEPQRPVSSSALPVGPKKVEVKIRSGAPLKKILVEAKGKTKADLIILGCTKGFDCRWQDEQSLPRKIAKMADCSVLLHRENKAPATITCCVDCFLDENKVSSSSLEIVSELLLFYEAELTILGLTHPGASTGESDVEEGVIEIINYFRAREIQVWIKLVSPQDLEEYVAKASQENMIGLLVGKQSFFGKKFSSGLMEKLLNNSQSSFLVLR